MSKGHLRRRAAAVTVVICVASPMVGVGTVFGDQISDKRAEAAKVADQVDELQAKAEVLSEQYNDAQLLLDSVNDRAAAAKARSTRTQATLAKRRKEMSAFAVAAYMRSGTGDTPSLILTSSGDDIGQRKGYASVASGQTADAVDRLRGAEVAAQADITRLAVAKAQVDKAKGEVDAKRKDANAAVDAATHVLDKVQGELRTLVRAEQARRAAAAAAAARAAAAKLAAQQAAYAAAHPNRPRPQSTTSSGNDSSDTSESGSDGDGSDGSDGAQVPDDVASVGEGADAAIAAARSVLGVRYTWAGASPSTGFDCSGLVMWAWQHGGKSLPHSSAAMYSSSRRIPLSAMEPGDLVFYGSPVHHVALYIGGGQIIHAPHTGSYVQIASVNYWSDIRGAGRVSATFGA